VKVKKQFRAGVSRRKFVQLALVMSPAFALAACGEQATSTVAAITGAPPSPTTAPAAPTLAATATQPIPTATQVVPTTAPAPMPTTVAPVPTTAASVPGTTQRATQVLLPTPNCTSKVVKTIAEEEGPYFKPTSPERASLIETGIGGTKLVVAGYVLSTDCKPVKNALLDFWQADTNGQYDLQGFKLRGHQYTDENGRFSLETVVPGLYPGRTRHIHVKVQAPNQSILTTQLYFPNEARNQTDRIFNQTLLLQMQDVTGGGKQGSYNFVLSI